VPGSYLYFRELHSAGENIFASLVAGAGGQALASGPRRLYVLISYPAKGLSRFSPTRGICLPGNEPLSLKSQVRVLSAAVLDCARELGLARNQFLPYPRGFLPDKGSSAEFAPLSFVTSGHPAQFPALSSQATAIAGRTKLIARSASATMVRLGLTPRLVATTEPSQMYMFW